jgi:hypothetical protein
MPAIQLPTQRPARSNPKTPSFSYSLAQVALGLVSLSLLPLGLLLGAPQAFAQQQRLAQNSVASPDELKPLTQSTSILSTQGGQRLMQEAQTAINAQNYKLAQSKLQEARQAFNQISNFYQDLGKNFSGIDNRVADRQRIRAVETAEMRDQATYQLALVHRAQNQPELAVPLLVQIIGSQGPTRELGRQSYQQLYELGFVDMPFTRNTAPAASSAPATAPAAPAPTGRPRR